MSSWQGGPSRGPGDNGTPDWAALAEESAARARRRRWLLIGGGVLATALVGAIVATAVVSTGGGDGRNGPDRAASDLPAPVDLPEDTAAPAPSFSSVAPPPPPDPEDYITSARKDPAPITVDGFFPGRKLAMGDRIHLKGATDRTADCAAGTQGALGQVLKANGCEQLIRATYRKDGVAVTVGIAVFATEARAKKTVDQASGGIASLSGGGVPTFCRAGTVCRRTTNSYGRYAYFSVGGYLDGTRVTTGSKDVYAVGDDLTDFAFRQIHRRGQLQAARAAADPDA
ncbi:hypothetical protein EES43_17640 [Streptomyces sp. ADI96-02]|uniref:hypothetical protein n=1 Tax=unclassified Streptomyces TaxID=2593676 RepID=UPI000F5543B7|nr:hypothetical protein [Streptomyces sp. ADI96-02]RPK59994.1 hypothetical protein EES43_17640 [Streptomyces sp. ADI96-02]